MLTRRSVIGLCVLCALILSGISVQGAAATTLGTTGFTCKKKAEPGGAGFSKEHCKAEDAVASGAKYEHVAIPENVTTEGRAVNQGTGGEKLTGKLFTKIGGLGFEFQATEMIGEATGTNKKRASGEHYVEGFGKTTFKGVTVPKPAALGCKVKGGELTTSELRASSVEMEGKLEPAVGTNFLSITLEGCSTPELNKTYPVEGSIRCPGDGSTALCTDAATTKQGTLTVGGQVAGIEVTTTATGRAKPEEALTPVAVTTIETP